jgi:hypothetical protein
MTIDELKNLKYGDYCHHKTVTNSDGTPARVRITGKVKTWKTRPSEARAPYKRGLYEYGYIDETNMDEFNLGYGS